MISSQNNVRKYRTKGHEQVYDIQVVLKYDSYQSKFAMQMKRVSIRTATNMLKIIMVISCRRECLCVLGRTSLETTYFSLKLEELPSENVESVRSILQHLALNWGPRLKISKVQRLWCIFLREKNLNLILLTNIILKIFRFTKNLIYWCPWPLYTKSNFLKKKP